jgi:hypothetical protein
MKNHTMPSNMFLIMHEAETTTRRRVMCVHPNCVCIYFGVFFFLSCTRLRDNSEEKGHVRPSKLCSLLLNNVFSI